MVKSWTEVNDTSNKIMLDDIAKTSFVKMFGALEKII